MIYLMDFCGMPWCILPWLLSGLLGFLMGYLWMRKWMNQFNEMETKYKALSKKHKQLEEDYNACKSARAKVEGDLSTANGVAKEAQADLSKVKTDLSNANDAAKKAQSDLARTKADLEECRKSKKSSANLGSAATSFAAGAAVSNLASKPKETPKPPAPKAEAPKAEAPKAAGVYAGLKSDNLQIIEGIGPKMESVLHAAGVKTWSNLAGKSHQELRAILDSHGDKYKIINPSTWAEQAALAAKGDFDGLISLQKDIDGNAGASTNGSSDSKLEKIIGKTQKAGYSKYKTDDLKIVEGMGPKIAGLLVDAGINTWAKLSDTPVSKIQQVLDAAGPRYKLAQPGSWPRQAGLAAAGKWEELRKLQDDLDGGK